MGKRLLSYVDSGHASYIMLLVQMFEHHGTSLGEHSLVQAHTQEPGWEHGFSVLNQW